VRFVKYDGADTNSPVGLDELFECNDGVWSRMDNRTKLHESLTETVSNGLTTTTRVMRDGGPLGKILSGTMTVSQIIGTGVVPMARDTLTAEWDGITDSWRQTTMTYWDERSGGSNLIGLPKFRQNPDGSWEYRAYDADGREILRVQARNDSAVPAFVSSIVPAGLNDFANVAGLHASVMVSGYGGAENELPSAKRKPRSIWSYEIQGGTGTILTGCEWHNYTEETINGYAVACHRVERAASQSSPWKGYSGNLVSIDRSYADEPGLANRAPVILAGRPISNLSADGSLTSWEYVLNEAESNLVITTRRGTVAAPNGVAYRTTYDVETLDSRSGQTLKSETRLYTAGGVTPDPELSSVVNIMDSNGRVLKSLYSDGTSISNVWGCCKIDETIGRDGIKSSSSTVTRNGALVTVSAQQWMESLPGTQGRYTVTESSSDALGRETNTTVYVCHNGAADFDYDPQTTLTFYPYGTSNYRISVSPSGMESVSRSYSDGGWEVDETSSAGVTSVVRRASGGGQTVSERIWTDTLTGLPAWTRETTSTSWLADGRKVETIISESSDREGATVTSQTTYDFLGRMVMTTTPLGESSSFYQGARLVRSSRTGMPNTLYFYDSVTGEQRDTVVDVNRNGIVDYAGSDRISRSESCYALLGSDWWRVTTNLVWNQEGSATPLATSVSRERITGLGTPSTEGYGGVLTAQSQSLNWRSAVTTSRTYTDANSSMVWQVTDVPDSSYNDVSLSMGGHVIAANSSIGNTYSFSYDGFGRQITYTDDGRNATSVTHYNSLGQVDFTEDATSNRTCYAYDSLGRKVSQTFLSADGSLSNCTYTAYDVLGQPLAVWGATYPVAYEYDLAGRMTSMYTYRGTNETAFVNAIRQSDINAIRQLSDRTQWLYEPVTGLLTNKLYADGKGPAYTYTTGGRLQTRTWARGVVTAYGYDSLGQLVSVQYSDGTPAVTNTYDRLGRKLSSITAVSTNTFEYTGLELSAETQNSDRIGRSWWPSGQAKCTAINPTPDGTDAESFDDTWINASGQLEYLQKYLHGNYLPWFWYGYQAGREQPSQVYSSWDIDKIIIRETTYEPARDIISAVTATWGAYDYNIENWISWPLTSFNYGNDGLGRRTNRVDVTPTLTVTNAFGYNLKSEVTSATMANGESNYNYDPIGNRVFSSLNALTSIYSANALNQYTAITNSVASVPPCLISPSYDYDGNLTTNGVWSYSWDGENRLKAVYSNDVLVVSNSYDDQSRRIRKVTAGGTRSFLYDGWNVLRESAGSSTNYFLWGTDLSGTLQGAGGVGGLLAVYTVNAGMTSTYYPCYDANGNITAYVDDLGFARAEYAYDAFGNTISQSGDLATTFSHRFSTKYADDETGLYYYGYRYYSSELGRWVNRDPIEESGGANVYGFVGNDGVGVVDSLGLSMVTPPMPFIFNPGLRSREREWILVADSISSLIKHWGINITYDLAGTTPSGTWKGNNIQLSPFFNQQGVVLNPYDQPLQVGVFGYKENYKFVVDNSGKYNDFAHRDAAIVHELIGIVVNKFDGKMSDGYGNFAGSHHASGLQDFSLLAEFGVLAGIRPGYVTHKMLVSRGRDYGGLPLTTKILEDQVSDYAKAIQFVCACEDGKQEGKEYKSTSYERTRNPWSSPSEKIKLQSWLKCQGRKISNGGVSVKLWQFKHKQVEM
jgi:RHS repeat-associated protein